MKMRPETREPAGLTFKSLRKRYINRPARKKWRIMMVLKAISKGRIKKRPFNG